MNSEHKTQGNIQSSTFMRRLAQDTAGATMIMVSSFVMPMMVLVGSSVDLSRQYMVKTRLQQACDTAVLAGRKALTAGNPSSEVALSSVDNVANTQAQSFFTNNFGDQWMGTTTSNIPAKLADGVTDNPNYVKRRSLDVKLTPEGEVKATATATTPMTIMRAFGTTELTTKATCTARMDVPDTDVMFVLDTTGSMANKPDGTCGGTAVAAGYYTRPTIASAPGYSGTQGYREKECPGARIAQIRQAVKDFYSTLQPNGIVANVRHRYGFVTYSATVNVGYLLPQSALSDTTPYPTRWLPTPSEQTPVVEWNNTGWGYWQNKTSVEPVVNGVANQAACDALATRQPTTGFDSTGLAYERTGVWSSGNKCTITRAWQKPKWRYETKGQSTSTYKTGAAVTDPTKITGATVKWPGCIEEFSAAGQGQSSFDPASLPNDINPDYGASGNGPFWYPAWADVVYERGNDSIKDPVGADTMNSATYGESASGNNSTLYKSVTQTGDDMCGKPAQRLAELTAAQIAQFVDAADFVPRGSTYHDAGMIWGARLISPTGMFASDTTAAAGRSAPQRFIIFMTDGVMSTGDDDYGLWGMEKYNKRIKGNTSSSLTDLHAARFFAACDAAKLRGITVFTVVFGSGANVDLSDCASPGKAFRAAVSASDPTISQVFQNIASDIAALRLSQ